MPVQAQHMSLHQAKWTASMSLGHQKHKNKSVLACQMKGVGFHKVGRLESITDIKHKCIA